MNTTPAIHRLGSNPRWSDVVIHNGVARWVEVAEDTAKDAPSQIRQILDQIDATLASLHAERSQLLEVVIHLAEISHIHDLNLLWDGWVVPNRAPVRACVQSVLGGTCLAEFIIHAAIPAPPERISCPAGV